MMNHWFRGVWILSKRESRKGLEELANGKMRSNGLYAMICLFHRNHCKYLHVAQYYYKWMQTASNKITGGIVLFLRMCIWIYVFRVGARLCYMEWWRFMPYAHQKRNSPETNQTSVKTTAKWEFDIRRQYGYFLDTHSHKIIEIVVMHPHEGPISIDFIVQHQHRKYSISCDAVFEFYWKP